MSQSGEEHRVLIPGMVLGCLSGGEHRVPITKYLSILGCRAWVPIPGILGWSWDVPGVGSKESLYTKYPKYPGMFLGCPSGGEQGDILSIPGILLSQMMLTYSVIQRKTRKDFIIAQQVYDSYWRICYIRLEETMMLFTRHLGRDMAMWNCDISLVSYI